MIANFNTLHFSYNSKGLRSKLLDNTTKTCSDYVYSVTTDSYARWGAFLTTDLLPNVNVNHMSVHMHEILFGTSEPASNLSKILQRQSKYKTRITYYGTLVLFNIVRILISPIINVIKI